MDLKEYFLTYSHPKEEEMPHFQKYSLQGNLPLTTQNNGKVFTFQFMLHDQHL